MSASGFGEAKKVFGEMTMPCDKKDDVCKAVEPTDLSETGLIFAMLEAANVPRPVTDLVLDLAKGMEYRLAENLDTLQGICGAHGFDESDVGPLAFRCLTGEPAEVALHRRINGGVSRLRKTVAELQSALERQKALNVALMEHGPGPLVDPDRSQRAL